jgi:hypothetical protein
MAGTRCKKGFRKCIGNQKCMKTKKQHHFTKKKLSKCPKGSRRCKNLKCYKYKK